MIDDTFQAWRLDDARQPLVLAARRTRLPEVVYWGPPLPKGEDLGTLYHAHMLDVTGGMLDENPDLSILPEASRTFPGQPGLIIRAQDGTPLLPKFCFDGADQTDDTLTLHYKDAGTNLRYTARFQTDPDTRIITAKAMLDSDAPVHLHWLSAPVIPGPQLSDEMIDVAGRWTGEFQLNRTAWSPGMRYRENRTGRTGHEHFPGLIVPCRGATNTQGHAYAFHYGWSGGHKMIAEELPDGRRQIQFGHAARMEVNAATHFESASLYITFSDDGLNGCAVAFQRHLRDRIVTPTSDKPRPVHYNCWEAVYFDHKLDILQDIASRAAALGAERFVLDDGWFGQRDDDTTSLSDWQVDPRKYPDGLGPLIDHVHGEGMSFGIWFEPEMINPDSDIHRAHPDCFSTACAPTSRRSKLKAAPPAAVALISASSNAPNASGCRIQTTRWNASRCSITPPSSCPSPSPAPMLARANVTPLAVSSISPSALGSPPSATWGSRWTPASWTNTSKPCCPRSPQSLTFCASIPPTPPSSPNNNSPAMDRVSSSSPARPQPPPKSRPAPCA